MPQPRPGLEHLGEALAETAPGAFLRAEVKLAKATRDTAKFAKATCSKATCSKATFAKAKFA